MTFAPIHDFLPRKFPQQYGGGEAWQNLPAFVVDRDDNKNKWLQDVFLTTGKDASKQPIIGNAIPLGKSVQ